VSEPLRPLAQMIWTRPIEGQPMAGRLRVATAIRAIIRAEAEVREHIVAPALDRGVAGILGALGAWVVSLVRRPLLPIQCLLYANPREVRRAVSSVDPTASVIYLDGVRTFAVLRALRRRYPAKRIVVDFDDLMSRRMAMLIKADEPLSPGYLTGRLPPALVKWVTGPVGRLIVRYERATLPAVEAVITRLADSVVLLSQKDMQELGGDGAARRATIPPMVVPTNRAPVLKPGPIRFIFAGTDSLTQNRLTIDYLIDLWRRERLGSQLVIFGRQQRRLALPANVAMAGYVEDIADAYDGQSVLVSPSFLAGGIKTKVIEAFAHGTAVIGNAVTFEAMPLVAYPLVSDGEADLLALLREPETHRSLFEQAARVGADYVRRHHAPEEVAACWREELGWGNRP
jgi:glycosyltransferase involved in cell wall biosynthesis